MFFREDNKNNVDAQRAYEYAVATMAKTEERGFIGDYRYINQSGKNLLCVIPPQISLKCNEKAIRQLVSILMDNALKYSPENGLISVEVQKQGRHISACPLCYLSR